MVSIERVSSLLVSLALALVFLVGGAESYSAISDMAAEVILAAIIAVWCLVVPRQMLFAVPRSAWIIVALVIALPLIQLIPLPPALWHALPGRGLEGDVLGLIGQRDSWRSLSVSPHRTMSSLLAIAPVAMLLPMVAAVRKGRSFVVLIPLVTVVLINVLVAAGQISLGRDSFLYLWRHDVGYVLGLFSGHNTAADFFNIGIVAVAALAWQARQSGKIRLVRGELTLMSLVVTTILILAVVLTGSRAGMLMVPLALLGQLTIIWPWLRSMNRWGVALGAAGMLVLIGGATLAQRDQNLLLMLHRFDTQTESRPDIWRDSAYTMVEYLPFGAGMGTFKPVFEANETLELVYDRYQNRAHNDYLELAIETGLFGPLLLAGIVAFTAFVIFRVGRKVSDRSRGSYIFSVMTLALLGLHSLIDYPVRSMAIAAVVAASMGMLLGMDSDKRGVKS